jgi:septation ring formation regulator EzrA
MSDNKVDLQHLGREILNQLKNLKAEVRDVKTHESQNGGWNKVNETLSTLVEKVDEIDDKISDPEAGIIARLRELERWREDTSFVTKENRQQNDRLTNIETSMALQKQRMQLQQKFLMGIAITAGGLLTKAILSLVIS